MAGCHLKSRYTFHQIIPTSHLSSSLILHAFTPMWILHPGQFALTFFRFASWGYGVTKGWLLVLTQDKWSAVYSVQTILLSLQSLLGGRIENLNEAHLSLILYSRTKQRISLEHRRIKSLGISRVWVDSPRCEPYLIPDFSVQSAAPEALPTN